MNASAFFFFSSAQSMNENSKSNEIAACSCIVEWLNCVTHNSFAKTTEIQKRKTAFHQIWCVNLMTIEYNWNVFFLLFFCINWCAMTFSCFSLCQLSSVHNMNVQPILSIIYLNCSDSKCALSDVISLFRNFIGLRHCRTAFTLAKVPSNISSIYGRNWRRQRLSNLIIASISHVFNILSICLFNKMLHSTAANDIITCRCGWHFTQLYKHSVWYNITQSGAKCKLNYHYQLLCTTKSSELRLNNNQCAIVSKWICCARYLAVERRQ